jgi:hypothetical protein
MIASGISRKGPFHMARHMPNPHSPLTAVAASPGFFRFKTQCAQVNREAPPLWRRSIRPQG